MNANTILKSRLQPVVGVLDKLHLVNVLEQSKKETKPKSLEQMNNKEKVNFFRTDIAKEQLIVLDFEYISDDVENFWIDNKERTDFRRMKIELMSLFLKKMKTEDADFFERVGFSNTKIAGICIKNIFHTDSDKLALLAHESLSELFGLVDLKYEYEEHKALYLKPTGENYRDWGNGYGEITPHSDDLYESLNIDLLSLTVCRDKTKTPTTCFFPKDLLNDFSDDEIVELLNLKATFKSGKNVDILKARDRNIIEYSEKYGFRFFLDFRVDNITGDRMLAIDKSKQYLLNKLNDAVEHCEPQVSIPETGTFLIVANHKVLHSREKMNISKDMAKEYAYNTDFSNTPRLLFRSKGPRSEQYFMCKSSGEK
jgi:hypothetical protein